MTQDEIIRTNFVNVGSMLNRRDFMIRAAGVPAWIAGFALARTPALSFPAAVPVRLSVEIWAI